MTLIELNLDGLHENLDELRTAIQTVYDRVDNLPTQALDEGDVEIMIERALDDHSDLDEDDVRRIADEAISEADNADVRDLERRFDRYAQKVDALVGGTQGIGADTAMLEARVIALEQEKGPGHDTNARLEDLGTTVAYLRSTLAILAEDVNLLDRRMRDMQAFSDAINALKAAWCR